MQLTILGFAFFAAVLLLVLVMGPPSRPNLFSVLFIAAMAGLALSVMALQVAEPASKATSATLERVINRGIGSTGRGAPKSLYWTAPQPVNVWFCVQAC
jgi:hypothetical protein